MPLSDLLLAGAVSVGCGLDRTAAGQFMISRPIVAAPLTGWLLGEPLTGLQVGALVELLWLGRLPIGAAIPPDDTQVATGAATLAVTMGRGMDAAALPLVLLAVMVAVPLGKMGQFFERMARRRNGLLLQRAEGAVDAGNLQAVDRCHLQGLLHFALSSLATFAVIVAGGWLLITILAPFLLAPIAGAAFWLRLGFILAGSAVILGTINVSRSMTLFAASFATAFLLLWLL